MQHAGAVLEEPRRTWDEPAEAGAPNLTVLEPAVVFPETPELAIIPTPIRVRGRTILARFGPVLVFALAVAGIVWFWPPY